MRIALGAFSHEANTFSPHLTTRADFEAQRLWRGEALLEGLKGLATEEAGAMSVVGRQGDCQVLPLLSAKALSGGPVLGDVFRSIRDELLERLRAALPVDGVLLVLHGAMMAEGEPDATGEVLRAVREMVGPNVPVVGTLDLHANVTARMVQQATALIGYHTAPHVDAYETGQSAARILLDAVQGKTAPTMALERLPMIVPAENARHTEGPLAEVIGMALAMERGGKILHGGIYAVQPWMDTEDLGCSVVVVTDDDAAGARAYAQSLARAFWERREAFVPELVPPEEAVRRALAREKGMMVLCDSADSPTSGSTGDSTVVLQAVLRAAPFEQVALLNIVDPQAVEEVAAAGVGSELTVGVGGKLAPSFWEPVDFRGYVRLVADGIFRHKGPGMRGVTQRMGKTVVLTQGGIHLVVMERAVSQWDPQLYRSLGEEPTDARIVQVKSPTAFRAAYGPLADEIVIVESPGVSTPKLSSLPWKHLRRPIYPLDLEIVYAGLSSGAR